MITQEAAQLARRLAECDCRVVLAESCTAGLAAALLAAVPGVSAYLCGSWVTYREECKQAWLGVPAALLREKSAVSPEVTACMATEALRRTPSAQFAAAITGHLGPEAPETLDGVCFLAVATRQADQVALLEQRQITLVASERTERQHEAARRLLEFLATALPPV
jgi:nicotinamide-nucleotide amidase